MSDALCGAALGTGFAFLMTTLGAAFVFLFRFQTSEKWQRAFLGFAAGVMIAASVWSLLIPSIEATIAKGGVGWIPAAGGFVFGGAFLLWMDRVVGYIRRTQGGVVTTIGKSQSTFLLLVAVTIHNIPEGMAIGLAFAFAAQNPEDMALRAAAFALALGIGIQNIPEGAAISIPLKQEGIEGKKAFFYAMLSGVVEPVFGILVSLFAHSMEPVMPWLLSFAAGTMMYVVADELIPKSRPEENSNIGSIGVMGGFLVMMILDVALK